MNPVKKVEWRLVLVGGLLVLAVDCESGPTAYDYLGDARRSLAEERYREAQTFVELAREKGAPGFDVQVLEAKIVRHRAVRDLEGGSDRKAFERFVRSADVDPRDAASAQTYLRAIKLGRRIGLSPSRLAPVAQKAVEADPSSTRARRAAGRLWEAAGAPKKALRSYLWLWHSDFSQIDVGRRLAAVYQQLGRTGDAIAVLRQLLNRAPEEAQAALKLADLYVRNGNPERARQLYEKLMERHPKKAGILLRYSQFLKQRGETERAENLRDRAYDLLPGAAERQMRELE